MGDDKGMGEDLESSVILTELKAIPASPSQYKLDANEQGSRSLL
jgi:hypothetical protein